MRKLKRPIQRLRYRLPMGGSARIRSEDRLHVAALVSIADYYDLKRMASRRYAHQHVPFTAFELVGKPPACQSGGRMQPQAKYIARPLVKLLAVEICQRRERWMRGMPALQYPDTRPQCPDKLRPTGVEVAVMIAGRDAHLPRSLSARRLRIPPRLTPVVRIAVQIAAGEIGKMRRSGCAERLRGCSQR